MIDKENPTSLGKETRIALGQQLRKARETVALSQAEVSQHLHVTPTEISAWEAGAQMPTLEILEKLANLYGRDLHFFLGRAPALPAQKIRFRSDSARSFHEISHIARQLIARFDELCRTAHELESAVGLRREVKIKSHPRSTDPIRMAIAERASLALDGEPVHGLRELIEPLGVRIFELPMDSSEFSGFSYWHEDYGPCILINAKDLPGRKNFTLAHEFGHLLYRDEPSVCDIAAETSSIKVAAERSVNLFAVAFLLPERKVAEDFQKRNMSKTPAISEIGKLAGRWGVSVQAMAYRLEELGLTEEGHAGSVLKGFKPKPFYRKSRTPAWRKRLGKPYVDVALKAYETRQISLGKLAKCLGVPLRKALEAAEHPL